MVDAGRKFTDKQIAEIEKQLKKEYQTALKEMQAKTQKVLARFAENDKKMLAKMNANEITYKQYIEWRQKAILRTKQAEGLVRDLTERAVHSDEIATEYINARIPKVYAENYNFATYDIEMQSKIDTSFTLVHEDAVSGIVTGRTPIFPIAGVDVPKDKRWNEKHIRSALTQGIIQGESIPKIAKRLQRVTDMDRVAATRNARTLVGRAHSAGRMESIKRANKLGLPVKKMWIATLDQRTRDSHVDLDGEVQEYDRTFSNGLDYPRASGPPEEVYNCFVGDTQIAVDSDILRGYRHPYDGEVISIETATGVKFTCTPNHPILTDRGWIHASELNKGENLLVARVSDKILSGRNPYINHVFARFDTLFKLLEKLSSQRACDLSVNFHGDVADSNVEVVAKEGFLRNDMNTVFGKKINEILFKCANSAFLGDSAFMKHFGSICLTTLCNVSRLDQALALFFGSLGHSEIHGLRTVTRCNTLFPKSLANSSSVNIKTFGELINRKSRVIKIDKIVNIEIKSFHGYVYNLQTDDNYYFVNNSLSRNGYFAIAHNCRCDMRPLYDGQKFNPSDLSLRNTDHFEESSYEEWKEKHRKHAEEVKRRREEREKKKNGNVKIQNTLVEPKRPHREDFATEELYQDARQAYRDARKVYSEQRDNLIDKWISEPTKYQTSDDVAKWAESRNVRLLGDVEHLADPKSLTPVLDTLDEMFERYPEVKQSFDDASYFALHLEKDERSYFMEANGGLRLSSSFLDARDAFGTVINMQAESFTTRGTGDLATLVRHEYGHNMDSVLRQKFSTLDSDYSWKKSGKLDRRNEARRQYEKELTEITLKHGSEYSRTNTLEAFAEGFSEYTSNPNSEYGKAFGGFFERWHNAHPIE